MTERTKWTLRGSTAALTVVLCAAAAANEQQESRNQQAQQGQQAQQTQDQRQTQRKDKMQQAKGEAQQPAPALVIGEIAEMRNVNLAAKDAQAKDDAQASSHRLLKVRQQNGQTVVVDAGVVSDEASSKLQSGDRIIAVGRAGRINGEPVVFARAVGELYSTGMVGSDQKSSKQKGSQQGSERQEQQKTSATGSSQPDGAQQGRQMSARDSGPHNRVAQNAGEPTNVLVVGKVSAARDVSLAATAGDRHRLLKVETDKGKNIVVDLGMPRGEISEANLKAGDRIVALGKPARINGRPVLFAANVAELQRVGQTEGQSAMTGGGQTRTMDSSAREMSEGSSAGTRDTAANDVDYATVVYLFETDNLTEDEYGIYDEDFAWETTDPVYDQWSDEESVAWDDTEVAHYDMFGYDDAGEEGLWDW
jgi:hypothetical protein